MTRGGIKSLAHFRENLMRRMTALLIGWILAGGLTAGVARAQELTWTNYEKLRALIDVKPAEL